MIQNTYKFLSMISTIAGLASFIDTVWNSINGSMGASYFWTIGVSIALIFTGFWLLIKSEADQHKDKMLQLYILVTGVLAVSNFIGISVSLDLMRTNLSTKISQEFNVSAPIIVPEILIVLFFAIPFVGAYYIGKNINKLLSGVGSIIMFAGFLYGALFMIGISFVGKFSTMTIVSQIMIAVMTATFMVAFGKLVKHHND